MYTEYCYVSESKFVHMYDSHLAPWTRIFTHLRSPNAQNMEVTTGNFTLSENIASFFGAKMTSHRFCLRISVIFRVKSAKAVKITDVSLLKRLGCIWGVMATCLLVRTLVAPPQVVVGRTAEDLKAFLCQSNRWDYIFTSSKWKTSFLQGTFYRLLLNFQ